MTSEPLRDPAPAPTVIVGHLDPATGKMTWIAHECPLCMKAILDEEWQEHVAWHARGGVMATTRGVSLTLHERFWAHVDPIESGCLIWRGCVTWNGYGRFSTRPRAIYAHRFAYEDQVGPIPDGMTLDHTCRVRACVNPDHLEPVTNRENLIRGLKARGTYTGRWLRP